MAIGLSDAFNILERSPHDAKSPCSAADEGPKETHWVPSRYNMRAKTEDDRLILWNTLSGSMSLFEAPKVPLILKALKKKGFEAKATGMVKYLVDRGFLIPKDTNEFRQFQAMFGKQHYRSDLLQLILMPSEDCNFRCDYCYEEFARGTMTPETREGVKAYVKSQAKRLSHLHIGWFGGEPLYGWEAVKELAPYCQEVAREHGLTYYSHMTTNGYLLTPERAKQCLDWDIRHFQITIDGHPDDHNKNRPTRTGEGTFDQIYQNLKHLASTDEDFSVMLRVNFDNNNHKRVPEFLDIIKDSFGTDSRFKLHYHPVGQWGSPNDAQLEVCGVEDQQQIMKDMVDAARERGFHFTTLKEMSAAGSQVCYAARPFNLLIGATGKVMKCTIVLDTDESNIVGHLTPEGELQINEDRMALWTEPAFEGDSQCKSCVVLPTCQGIHCPLIRMQQDTQPCIKTRRYGKNQMLAAVDLLGDTARKVQVNGG